jgi:hypothetical protein
MASGAALASAPVGVVSNSRVENGFSNEVLEESKLFYTEFFSRPGICGFLGVIRRSHSHAKQISKFQSMTSFFLEREREIDKVE